MRRPAGTGRSRPAYWIITALVAIGLLEAAAYGAIALANVILDEPVLRRATIYEEQSRRIRELLWDSDGWREIHDPVLGWRTRPGHATPRNVLNRQGLRAGSDYAEEPPPGTLRIAAFGDSFVFGNEVGDEEVWTRRLEVNSGFEVLNYGVPAYGMDQAYLRFRHEGMDLSPAIVLIGFAPPDLRRLVNVYRRFIDVRDWAWIKPRFVLSGDSLSLIPNPAPDLAVYRSYLDDPGRVVELAGRDQWYSPLIYENPLYDLSATVRILSALWTRFDQERLSGERMESGGRFRTASSAFQIQTRLLEAFVASVEKAGARPVVVLFPDRPSVRRVFAGLDPVYSPLIDVMEERGIEHIDLAEALTAERGRESVDHWFAPFDHHSPAAHEVFAAWLARELTKRARGAQTDM